MIKTLKHIAEESDKKEDVEHLELTDEIRREIMQSCSGVLNKTRFEDILTRARKVHLLRSAFVSKDIGYLNYKPLISSLCT